MSLYFDSIDEHVAQPARGTGPPGDAKALNDSDAHETNEACSVCMDAPGERMCSCSVVLCKTCSTKLTVCPQCRQGLMMKCQAVDLHTILSGFVHGSYVNAGRLVCALLADSSFGSISLAMDGMPQARKYILQQRPELEFMTTLEYEMGRSYSPNTYTVQCKSPNSAAGDWLERELAAIQRIQSSRVSRASPRAPEGSLTL